MDLTTFRALLTPSGQDILGAAGALIPTEESYLADFTRLRRHFPAGLAQAALEIAIQRRKAVVKFPDADRLYFSREALEQASSAAVSAWRAQRYRPFRRVFDLGCAAGGDTLALAALVPTLGIDLDPLRLEMARANLNAMGLSAAWLRADLTAPLPMRSEADTALFFDPARRSGQRRVFSVRDYTPPLEAVLGWLADTPAVGVKISPGVDLAELADYAAEVEFISLEGELKEAVLWFGPLKTAARRATRLPGPHTLLPDPAVERAALSEPGGWLYEPDPAVLRAGLVKELAARLGAAQLDPDIAYLTAAERVETPFARVWQVEDWLPFNLKRLREVLRARRVGHVTVKKRGSPIQPEALIHDLKLKGDQQRVIFLTHLNGRPIVVIGW
jgi:SAM-dependent methyltransferase